MFTYLDEGYDDDEKRWRTAGVVVGVVFAITVVGQILCGYDMHHPPDAPPLATAAARQCLVILMMML